jgi:hypothetical protein
MNALVDIKKQCRDCCEIKDITLFKKQRKVCICCYKIYMKKYYLERKDNILIKTKVYYKNNDIKLKEYAKNYYKNVTKIKNINNNE